MKPLHKVLCFTMLATGLLLASCNKKDDDPQSCFFAQELQDELNAINAAADVYINNPTTANCEAYKSSLQAYLNAAEDLIPCATQAGQAAELQAAIDQEQAAVDAIQC